MSDHRTGAAADSRGQAEHASQGQDDPLVGRTINGRFRVTGVIARGGMGKVYTAEQAPLGRICALKVLSPRYEGDHDPDFHRRFFLEASTAAKITHPNTITIFDYGKAEEGDVYYIAMEYIEGRTLFRALREDGPFPEARAAHVARQICRGVREAHKIGVVHRDLKPGNVLLVDHADEHDIVKVLDFGLVKVVSGAATGDMTEAGLFMGSPKYMAPEQILGHDVAASTDVYSLGVMLFEMLCGKVPFDRGTNMHTLMAHVHDPLPPMEDILPGLVVSPTMEAIVARALAKDPAARFPSMDEMLAALKAIGGGEGFAETHEGLPRAIAPSAGGPRSVPASGPRQAPTLPSPGGAAASGRAPAWLSPMSPSSPPSSSPPTRPDLRAPLDASPDTLRTASQEAGLVPSSAPGDATGALPAGDVVAAPPKKRGFAAAIVAAAAVAAGAAAILVATSGAKHPSADGATGAPSATAAAPAPSTAATASATAEPTANAASPAVVAPRVVRVDSDPAGAAVSEGNRTLCTATPCEASVADDAAPHTLSIEKHGFKPAKLTVEPADKRVTAKLDPMPVVPAAPLKDYKPSPY